jgi:hypothetical protein
MSCDILVRSDRFNLSEVKDHFINPCCFGEDLAAWLQGKLMERNVDAKGPGQEDWGWYLEVFFQGATYFLGVGGNSEEDPNRPNYGEWRLMVEKNRSLFEKLLGKNKFTEDDDLVRLTLEIIKTEPGFESVKVE